MSEFSMPWPTSTYGDGEYEYTAAQWWGLFGDMFGEGIAPKVGGALRPSASAPIAIQPGRALIGGVLYVSDSIESIDVPTPAANTGYRIILQRDDAEQTVRLALIASTQGVVDLPSFSSALPLCGFTMTSAGEIIDFVDERKFIEIQSTITANDIESVDFSNLVDDETIEFSEVLRVKRIGTEEVAERAITYTKAGERNLAIPHRIGYNDDKWGVATPHNSDFAPRPIDINGVQVAQIVGSTGTMRVDAPNAHEQITIPIGIDFLKPPHLMFQLIGSSNASAFISIDTPNSTLTARLTRLNDVSGVNGIIHFILTGPVA